MSSSSTTPSDDERWLMMAVLDHLQKASTREGMNTESLQEAIFAISNAYTLNMHSSATKQKFPLDGLSLPDVYKAGRLSLVGEKNQSNIDTDTEMKTINNVNNSTGQSGFDRFVQRLQSTTSFFNGVESGTPEFEQRLSHARRKYDERLEAKKKQRTNSNQISERQQQQTKSTLPTSSSATPETRATETETVTTNRDVPPPSSSTAGGSSSSGGGGGGDDSQSTTKVISEADKQRAKTTKERGNAQLKAKQYEAALQSYNQCIELDSENAVYYSNRAAANIKLSRYTDAVDDCKKAISLDPEFARPRERLALAYRHLGMTKNETDCLRAALAAHPNNETFVSMLQDAETRLNFEEGSASASGPGSGSGSGSGSGGPQINAGMIDMMSRSLGLNMPDGLAQSLANSDVVNQVGSMVRDNPAMVEQIMRMVGSGGMGGGGGSGNSGGANGSS